MRSGGQYRLQPDNGRTVQVVSCGLRWDEARGDVSLQIITTF